ncbi:SUF system NifU family Fe-S cluster assembly protein [bacterium]|nr:SUF system NifU family Fe-S cluster assembly protein [bacterium]NUN44302.1 SUF system NifU family Fe-S cluster assembly protein [bacterium]HND77228.1 SUF system NifU family Fe-S cluster assembly protein [bacterium]HNI12819.1 SUF system NifU family Fe-S cluster assembly protein [bacterium]HNM15676.1 SUF system NifU family Fe-S cluster assembly protein [bacterium]
MMSDLRELYQEVILDHNKNPRNFRVMENADIVKEGFNPLCGDHLHLYLKLDGDVIQDVSFEGNGCAISKSSASLMTTVLKGKTKSDAEVLFKRFHDLVTADMSTTVDEESLGKLAVFAGVREFPARVKCASLAWHTMHAAIANDTTIVSTE